MRVRRETIVPHSPHSRFRLPSARAIVRRFLRHLHVMHVALALAGTGDLPELRPRAHVLDGGTADVAHGRAQAAGELVHTAAEPTAVRHAAFPASWPELFGRPPVLVGA